MQQNRVLLQSPAFMGEATQPVQVVSSGPTGCKGPMLQPLRAGSPVHPTPLARQAPLAAHLVERRSTLSPTIQLLPQPHPLLVPSSTPLTPHTNHGGLPLKPKATQARLYRHRTKPWPGLPVGMVSQMAGGRKKRNTQKDSAMARLTLVSFDSPSPLTHNLCSLSSSCEWR